MPESSKKQSDMTWLWGVIISVVVVATVLVLYFVLKKDDDDITDDDESTPVVWPLLYNASVDTSVTPAMVINTDKSRSAAYSDLFDISTNFDIVYTIQQVDGSRYYFGLIDDSDTSVWNASGFPKYAKGAMFRVLPMTDQCSVVNVYVDGTYEQHVVPLPSLAQMTEVRFRVQDSVLTIAYKQDGDVEFTDVVEENAQVPFTYQLDSNIQYRTTFADTDSVEGSIQFHAKTSPL